MQRKGLVRLNLGVGLLNGKEPPALVVWGEPAGLSVMSWSALNIFVGIGSESSVGRPLFQLPSSSGHRKKWPLEVTARVTGLVHARPIVTYSIFILARMWALEGSNNSLLAIQSPWSPQSRRSRHWSRKLPYPWKRGSGPSERSALFCGR